MRISRDKLNKLAHTVADTLADVDLVGFFEDRNTIRQEARKALEDRINEEVRVILEAYSEEMRKSGAQYAEMFKKVKTELAKKYKAVL